MGENMFLVDVRQDYEINQFATGDPREKLSEIFSREREQPSEDFYLRVTKLPVVKGTQRIA